MKVTLSMPQLGLTIATRAMLGAGLGLLLGGRLSEEQRRAVGWTLTGVGLATTVPLVVEILSHRVAPAEAQPAAPIREMVAH